MLIDLERLRDKVKSRTVTESAGGACIPGQITTPISRRSFMLRSTVVALIPLGMSDASPSDLDVQIVQEGRRIYLLRKGGIAFLVDPEHFAPAVLAGPSPHASLRRTPRYDRILLHNARLPGTRIRADMCLEIKRRRTGTDVTLTFPYMRWRLVQDLEAWLSGRSPATGRVYQTRLITESETLAKLSVRAPAEVAMTPDWQFAIAGKSAISAATAKAHLEADELRIWAHPGDAQRITTATGAHRTWLAISRGEHDWPRLLTVAMPSGTELRSHDAGFDTLDLEMSEKPGGKIVGAAWLRAHPDIERWTFQPGGNIHMSGGKPATLRLNNLQQVIADDGERREAHVLARFTETPQRLSVGSYSLLVRDAQESPGFEITTEQGTRSAVRVALKIDELHVPLEAGLLASSELADDQTLAIVYDYEPCPEHGSSCAVEISAAGDTTVKVPNLVTTVLRPRDLLHLNFQFRNFRLGDRDGEPTLFPIPNTTTDAANDPLLIVTFPPQHLAEQAVGNCDYNQLVALPLTANPSAPSRIAFKIPASYAEHGIPCRLERYLEWKDFQMQVVNNAVPEPTAVPPLLPNDWKLTLPTPASDWPDTPPWKPDNLQEPDDTHTALALTNGMWIGTDIKPWNLWLSPHDWSSWVHSNEPVTRPSDPKGNGAGLTELWHTRLAPFVGADLHAGTGMIRPGLDDGLRPDLQTVRAIWLDGYQYSANQKSTPPAPPDCTSGACSNLKTDLPAYDQAYDIVQLSGELGLVKLIDSQTCDEDPRSRLRAIPYSRLMLSSQGTTVKLDGRWNPSCFDGHTTQAEVDEWLQDTIWGRDQHSKISIKGYSLPTGHYISYIRERRREFRNTTAGGKTAVLVERYYCEVREATVTYPSFPPDDTPKTDVTQSYVEGRRWPFQSATLSPLRTPFLQEPYDIINKNYNSDKPLAFWMIPHVFDASDCLTTPPDYSVDKPFAFTLTLVDVAGNTVSFPLPLLWVEMNTAETDKNATQTQLKNLVDAYCCSAQVGLCNNKTALSQASLNRQKLAFAQEANPRPQPKQDTATETDSIVTSIELIAQTTGDPYSVWSDPDVQNSTPLHWPPQWPLNFYPAIVSAQVRLQSAAAIGAGDGTKTVQFNNAYRSYGFSTDSKTGHNKREVYLDIPTPQQCQDKPPTPDFNLPGGSSAGLNVPTFATRHLSRISGPIGDTSRCFDAVSPCPLPEPRGTAATRLASAGTTSTGTLVTVDDKFDPGAFFDTTAMLLGAVGLGDVIAPIEDILDEFQKVPGLVQQVTDDIASIQSKIDEVRTYINDVTQTLNALKDAKGSLQTVLSKVVSTSTTDAKALLKTLVEDQGLTVPTLESSFQAWRDQVHGVLQTAKASITLDNALIQLGCTNANACSDDLLLQAKDLYNATLAYASAVDQSVDDYITAGLWATDVSSYLTQLTNQANDLVSPLLSEFEPLTDLFQTATDALSQINQLTTSVRSAITQTQQSLQAYSDSNFNKQATLQLVQAVDKKLIPLIDPRKGSLGVPIGSIFGPPPPTAVSPPQQISDVATGKVGELTGNVVTLLTALFSVDGKLPPSPTDIAKNDAAPVTLTATTTKILQVYWTGANGLLSSLAKMLGLPYDPANLPTADAVEKAALPYIQTQVNQVRQAILTAGTNAVTTVLNDLTDVATKVTDVTNSVVADINTQVTAIDTQVNALIKDLQPLLDLLTEVLESIPQQLTVTYDWTPQLQSTGAFTAGYDNATATCHLHVEIQKSLVTGNLTSAPSVTVSCALANFTLNLLPSIPMISVGFTALNFKSENGAAPAVTATVGGVTLSGDLSFVNSLRSFFNQDSGPYLDPEPDHIVVGYRFPAVSITVGALNITQLSLDVGVTLPFVSGSTRARFAVSERDKPFLITCGIYGGGGFFALEATAQKIVSLEASFEFGAAAFVDIGLASGIASVMAGIYFIQGDGIAKLTGFFDANGSFDVIGLIQLNIDFYLGFTYDAETGCAYGEVEVTVEIGFTFFTIEVDLTEQKQLAGSSSSSGGGNGDLFTLPANLLASTTPLPQIAEPAKKPVWDTGNASIEALRGLWKRRHATQFTKAEA
jgi:hypothetical protein